MAESAIIQLAGFGLALLGTLFGVFKWVNAMINGLGTQFNERVNSESEKARLLIDKVSERESKARHDLASSVTKSLADMSMQLRQLERETPRREDITAMETRVMSRIDRFEGKLDGLGTKLDALAQRNTRVDNPGKP